MEDYVMQAFRLAADNSAMEDQITAMQMRKVEIGDLLDLCADICLSRSNDEEHECVGRLSDHPLVAAVLALRAATQDGR
jgi:hypothetical protein